MEVVSTSAILNQAQLHITGLNLKTQLLCLPKTYGINTTTNYLSKRKPFIPAAIYVETEAQAVLKQPVPPAPLLQCSSESLQYEAGKVGAVPDHQVTDGPVSAMEYVTGIFSTKVYDVAIETPLEKANKSILEPAGALALAGAEAYCKYYNLKDANVVAIASGANMNFDRLGLVTELADVGRQKDAKYVADVLPDEGKLGINIEYAELTGSFSFFLASISRPNNYACLKHKISKHCVTTGTKYLSKRKPFIPSAIYVETEAQAVLKQPVPPAPLLQCSSESLQYEAGKVGALPDHQVMDGLVSAMEYNRHIFRKDIQCSN
ncbi:hypothetical protein POM88_010112 [Heracleum sosnowskyi]|uniref:Threonine ammonia-lyase n=1 Tax=Heracleum sosnowskyi TaxID=360622 RepID=A0AAD8N856_9APIA|nr:hypothetical protein POM88_010112 [Heracleum sosnowskyi]